MNLNMNVETVHVIVTAAGSSRRFGQDKLWNTVNDKPILLHSLDRFSSLESPGFRILLLSKTVLETYWPHVQEDYRKAWTVAVGGETRQESIRNGLALLKDPSGSDLVVIHDGARPCLTAQDLSAVIEQASHSRAAILAAPLTDTLKRVADGTVIETLDRTGLYRALTPQVAAFDLLQEAFLKLDTRLPEFTDEASMLEHLGCRVDVVPCRDPNPKLTYPEDFPMVKSLLDKR